MQNIPFLNFFGDVDEKVCTVSFSVMCANEIVETDKSKSKVLCFRVLETGENDLHDSWEVLIKDSSRNIQCKRELYT